MYRTRLEVSFQVARIFCLGSADQNSHTLNRSLYFERGTKHPVDLRRSQSSLQLHPRALVGLEPPVERDGGVDVRRAVAGHVEDGRAEGARRAQHGLPVGRDLPREGEVGALHVGGHQEAEVARVHLAREVLLEDGGEREGVQRRG